MINPSYAVEQVRAWRGSNTNSLSPQFKECLDIVTALAEAALGLSNALANIETLKKEEVK